MPRRSRVDPVAVASVYSFGVAAVADLAALGLASSTIAGRVTAGRDRRLLRGVVKRGPDEPTADQRAAAALAYAGPDAVISGGEALLRYGLERPPDGDRILVLVAEGRQRTSSAFVVIERTHRLPSPVRRGGLALAPFDRAVVDAARRLDRRDAVRAVLSEAVQTRRTTVPRLVEELALGSQRGSALPRAVLAEEMSDGTRSVVEGWARELHAGSDLPPVLWNPRLYRPDGTYVGTPDAYFEKVGLAWQLDSVRYHAGIDGWDRTLRTHAWYQTSGLIVAHTRPSRLRCEPDAVLAELWGAYRLATLRPCPQLIVLPAV